MKIPRPRKRIRKSNRKLDAIKAELDGYMAELKECNDSIDSYKD